MKTVILYCRNHIVTPSSYYRVGQYLEDLKQNLHIKVKTRDFFCSTYYGSICSSRLFGNLKKIIYYFWGVARRLIHLSRDSFSRERSVIIVQKSVFPRRTPILARIVLKSVLHRSCTVIWDFDDNIKESGEISAKEFDLLCKYSTTILVCNEFLKSTLPESVQRKVKLIPTTDRAAENLDLDEVSRKRLETFDSEIRLVWVGTAGNLTYLQKILPELDKAAALIKESGKQLQLRIVSNSTLEYDGVALNIENVKWSRSVADDELKNAHIGLMPLEENYYTPGKCGFKAVQYIGMGLPAIVSDVGFNTEVVRDEYNGFVVSCKGQWTERIVQLAFDSQLWKTISNNARAVWKENFNTKDVIERLKEIIKS